MSVSRKTGEIYYTDEELRAALQNSNALEYALSRGYHLIRDGNEYRLQEHDSMVFKRNGKWHWNSRNLHGDALDFIQAYENKSYKEAVCILAGTIGRQAPVGPARDLKTLPPEEKGEFILPERAPNYKNLFAYLIKERGIDSDLVKHLIEQQRIYQGITYNKLKIVGYSKDGVARYSYKERFKEEFTNMPLIREMVNNGTVDSVFHAVECFSVTEMKQLIESGSIRAYQNLLMLGYDSDIPRYASMRSMNSSGKAVKVDVTGSDKSYPFILEGSPESNTVCVFESPVEAMSYWSLCRITESDRINCDMISTGGAGTSLSLDRYLKEHPEKKCIVVGYNNDGRNFGHDINAGENGMQRIQKLYGKAYTVTQHRPHLNDWNDVLKNYRHNLESKMPDLRSHETVRSQRRRDVGIAI